MSKVQIATSFLIRMQESEKKKKIIVSSSHKGVKLGCFASSTEYAPPTITCYVFQSI